MHKVILLALAVLLPGFTLMRAQVPQPMRPYPYPPGQWYLGLAGSYGEVDDEGNFTKGKVVIRSSSFYGVVGDVNVERAIGVTYTAGPSTYEIQILTDKGESDKFKMNFSGITDPLGEPTEFTREYRGFDAVSIVEGQPIGFRFFDMKAGPKAPPFAELRYDDPGEVPKIIVRELPANEIEWDISPALRGSSDNKISFDGGNTWGTTEFWGHTRDNYFFKPEELSSNPNPMIRYVVYHRLRRYVKYYTYGKGYHDDPTEPPVMAATAPKKTSPGKSAPPKLPTTKQGKAKNQKPTVPSNNPHPRPTSHLSS